MDPRRPSFATAFPRHPDLDAIVEAFEDGDYARVRSLAPGLIRSTADPQVAAGAQMLVDRTRPDPATVILLAIAAALVVVLSGFWIANGRQHSPSTPLPTRVPPSPRATEAAPLPTR